MKKLTTVGFLALSAILFNNTVFAQDSVKHSAKASKKTTHKVVKHHKTVKKTAPSM